jgi:hypothetical protein
MSRYYAEHKEHPFMEVNYGWDHALGYWCDIVDHISGNEEYEYIIEELSSITGADRNSIIEALEKFKVPEGHIQSIALDIVF